MKVFPALFLAGPYFTRRVVMVITGALVGLLVLNYMYGPGWDTAIKKAMSRFGAQSASASLKGAGPSEPPARMGRLSFELSQLPPDTESAPAVQTQGAQPRVIEGRDFVVPGAPATAALPAIEGAATNSVSGQRNAVENPRTLAVPAVMSVSPIQPGPPGQRADTPATPDPAKRGESEIETRLAATREWLAASPNTTYTLQLFGANSEEHLKADLATLSGVLSSSELYVYRTVIAGKPAYTVVYGSYPDRRTALLALDKLPPSVALNRPLVRTLDGIRGEQKRHGI